MKKYYLFFFLTALLFSCKKDEALSDDRLIGSTWVTEKHVIFESCDYTIKSEDFLEDDPFPCHPINSYTFTSVKMIKAQTHLLHYVYFNQEFTCLDDGIEKKNFYYEINDKEIIVFGDDHPERKGFFISQDSIVFSSCVTTNDPMLTKHSLVAELLIRKK